MADIIEMKREAGGDYTLIINGARIEGMKLEEITAFLREREEATHDPTQTTCRKGD